MSWCLPLAYSTHAVSGMDDSILKEIWRPKFASFLPNLSAATLGSIIGKAMHVGYGIGSCS